MNPLETNPSQQSTEYSPSPSATYDNNMVGGTSDPASQEGQAPQTNSGVDLSHPREMVRTAVNQVQQQAGGAVEQIKSQAGSAAEQIKNQAATTLDNLKSQTNNQLDSQMTEAGVSLGTVADAVTNLSDQLRRGNQELLANYADQAAGRVDQVATYLRQSDPNQLLRDIEDFARRDPTLFLASAFALGLLGTRFLKSSSHQVEP